MTRGARNDGTDSQKRSGAGHAAGDSGAAGRGVWAKRRNDGTIWLPSDSRPLPEFLEMPAADMICFDFSDNIWHIGFAGAVELANHFPEAKLLTIHWGCVDAPEYTPFNGDPERLAAAIKNPERVHALALGEGLSL